MRLLIVNGPNLNLLGSREPDVYGATTLADLEALIDEWAASMGVEVTSEQTNSEQRVIELIHAFDGDGVVINPGAFTHTSRAIADALRATSAPAVEVHISNVRAREPWRAISVIADACVRTIYGRGVVGYRDAMRHLVNRAAVSFETVRYGPHVENVGDLRVTGGSDLVVLAHGGLWRHEYERDTTESLAVDLARHGFDTWNVEYRRLGAGGGWPASGHDVLMALDFIPQLRPAPRRVVLVGHSAGSYLLMWAASRTSAPVAIHIALAPLIDLERAIAGGDAGAAEAGIMMEAGAPSANPSGIETILVHGDGDQIVPVDRSVEFAADHDMALHRTDCDHFSLLDPASPEWSWVVDRIGSPT
jgi:3-dehydroquinate dehydratase-2